MTSISNDRVDRGEVLTDIVCKLSEVFSRRLPFHSNYSGVWLLCGVLSSDRDLYHERSQSSGYRLDDIKVVVQTCSNPCKADVSRGHETINIFRKSRVHGVEASRVNRVDIVKASRLPARAWRIVGGKLGKSVALRATTIQSARAVPVYGNEGSPQWHQTDLDPVNDRT